MCTLNDIKMSYRKEYWLMDLMNTWKWKSKIIYSKFEVKCWGGYEKEIYNINKISKYYLEYICYNTLVLIYNRYI